MGNRRHWPSQPRRPCSPHCRPGRRALHVRTGRLCLPSADGGAVPTSPLPSPCTLEVSELRGEGQGHPAVQFRPEPALPSTLPDHGDTPCARPCPPPRVCVCTGGGGRHAPREPGGVAARHECPSLTLAEWPFWACPVPTGPAAVGGHGGARAETQRPVGLCLHRSESPPSPAASSVLVETSAGGAASPGTRRACLGRGRGRGDVCLTWS